MTFFRCLCLLFILCCCNSKPKTDAGMIRVSVLRGPSAIAFAHWMKETPVIDGKPLSVRIIDSPDLMQATLIKGEADIAVLPMISAVNLYNKGIRYHLAGCPIWGTLYLVGRSDKGISGENKSVLHIFGAGTTPDILTRHYLRQHKLNYTLNYSLTTAHEIMQGLLDVYLRTGNEKAYAMVEGLAGYVDRRMSKLDPATVARMMYTADANPQNEMGGMNEVLYQLYCVSGKPRYLELASLFDPSWFLEPLVRNEDILSGLHANTHIVLVNGFARRYESTGEECYRKSVANFWNMLMHSHAYVNGTSSGPRPNVTTETSLTAEHWGEPCHLCNTLTKGIAESCVTHNTQRLNASLFSWTGNPCYADVYMNMFYNAVLPVQSRSTGAYVYHLPLGSPRHKAYMADNDFKCCSGSCAEAFAKLNNGIYYHDDSAVYVNLYVPSKVHWADKKVGLEQAGGFPVEPIVDFTVSVRRPVDFVLNLFIPAWTDGAVVYVNGEKQEMPVRPSSFLKLSRRWADGDRVRIEFRYAFRLQSMPDKENMLAVFYGPMLLAFETRDEVILKGNKDEILAGLSFADSESGRFVLKNGEREFRLRPLFDVDKESYGVYATIRNY